VWRELGPIGYVNAMPNRFNRRQFVCSVPALGLLPMSHRISQEHPVWPPPLVLPPPVDEAYPSHPPALAKEIVGVAHSNLARVRELVGKYPTLAKAAWDWGFGDWESPLGAASHVGQRAIAAFLIEQGAGPTIFSAAMLGQLAVVQAFEPSVRDLPMLRGPHGITLIAHARAGGAESKGVVAYLESLAATPPNANVPLAAEDQTAISGAYAFGRGARDRFVVDAEKNQLGLTRIGATRRNLVHMGDLEFHPIGAPSVRVRFTREAGLVTALTIAAGDEMLRATRV
jgi:hypothetical protein